MAEIVSTLSSTGDRGTPTGVGDFYTDRETWQAAQQGQTPSGDTAVLECFAGTTVVTNWDANGWYMGQTTTLSGWTAGAFITIRAAAGERYIPHTKVGARFGGGQGSGNVAKILIQHTGVTISQLGIASGAANSVETTINLCTNTSLIDCYIEGNAGSAGALEIGRNTSPGCVVDNCIVVNTNPDGNYAMEYDRRDVAVGFVIRNCTFISPGTGIFLSISSTPSQAVNLINNVAFNDGSISTGSLINWTNFEYTGTVDSNIDAGTSDSGRGTNYVPNLLATAFVDYNGDVSTADNADFNVAVGLQLDGSVNPGADLSGIFTDDIVGTLRQVPWERGAYEIAGAAPGVSFDGPNIVAQAGTQDTAFSFDENGEGTVASRFTGATSYALAPTSDALPAGLTVNPTTGNIEGTPTEAVTRNITIEGSD